MEETIHIPVLKEEVLNYLACGAKKIFVDGTVGGGGHAKAILEASKPNGFLIGLDVDDEALVVAEKNLDNYRGRFILKKSNYAEMAKILMELGFEKVNGILLDLGLSSLQLGTPQRGFSFLQTGPLDMRMDKSNSLTAAQIVNHWPEFRLREIIKEFGEEKWAVRIAKKIIELMDKDESYIKFVEDRPGHDYRYALDNTKIEKEIGWKPKTRLEEGLEKTIKWYERNKWWWKSLKRKLKRENKGFWSI